MPTLICRSACTRDRRTMAAHSTIDHYKAIRPCNAPCDKSICIGELPSSIRHSEPMVVLMVMVLVLMGPVVVIAGSALIHQALVGSSWSVSQSAGVATWKCPDDWRHTKRTCSHLQLAVLTYAKSKWHSRVSISVQSRPIVQMCLLTHLSVCLLSLSSLLLANVILSNDDICLVTSVRLRTA